MGVNEVNRVKIIGTLSKKEMVKIAVRDRKVKTHGRTLGTVILTDIKSFPFTWARCKIKQSRKGLFAVKNGCFIRPVKANIVNDSSFIAVH